MRKVLIHKVRMVTNTGRYEFTVVDRTYMDIRGFAYYRTGSFMYVDYEKYARKYFSHSDLRILQLIEQYEKKYKINKYLKKL